MTLTELDFRLAAILGMPATAVKRRLTAREYLGWQILDARWPIGERRNDFRFALLAAAVANVFGGSAQVEDFLPDEAREMSDEQLKAAATVAAVATGTTHGSPNPQGQADHRPA